MYGYECMQFYIIIEYESVYLKDLSQRTRAI